MYSMVQRVGGILLEQEKAPPKNMARVMVDSTLLKNVKTIIKYKAIL